MKNISIGWLGDSQLDYAQYGLLRRRDDFISAVDWTIKDMYRCGISTIVHAGDFLQSNRPSPFTMKALQAMQKWMTKHQMVMYVISGNHDNAQPHWINIVNAGETLGFQLIDNVLVSREGITIQGLPNVSREEFLKVQFVPADILVMHQSVTQFIDFPTSNGIDVTELPFDKYQVIAIGDIHINRIEPILQLLPTCDARLNCVVGYSGATELNSESEPDKKYWVELQFEKEENRARLRAWSNHEIKTRPVCRIEIETADTLDKAVDTLKARLVDPADTREPIVFIRYNSLIPGVVDRFRKNFDPDKFILRFHPLFHVVQPAAGATAAPSADLSINDLLKAEVPETSNLYSLASQLFNPDLEPDHITAAIDQYVETRLSTPTETT